RGNAARDPAATVKVNERRKRARRGTIKANKNLAPGQREPMIASGDAIRRRGKSLRDRFHPRPPRRDVELRGRRQFPRNALVVGGKLGIDRHTVRLWPNGMTMPRGVTRFVPRAADAARPPSPR